MNIGEYVRKRLREDTEFRKFVVKNQWNLKFSFGCQLERLRMKAGLTQAQMAKKMRTHQSGIARAELYGCSFEFLQRAARAVGQVYKVYNLPAMELHPTVDYTATSSDTHTVLLTSDKKEI